MTHSETQFYNVTDIKVFTKSENPDKGSFLCLSIITRAGEETRSNRVTLFFENFKEMERVADSFNNSKVEA